MASHGHWKIGPARQLVEPGFYIATCTAVKPPRSMFGTCKLELVFVLRSGRFETPEGALDAAASDDAKPPGPEGVELSAYFNCKRDNSTFVILPGSNLFRAMVAALGDSLDDVEPLRAFVDRSFVVRVRTVGHDSKKRPLIQDRLYSTVAEIVAALSPLVSDDSVPF